MRQAMATLGSKWVTFLIFFLTLGGASAATLPLRAVSLGGWLLTEGWIKPSLFDGIPNKDLLDGTQVQLRSVAQGTYLSAERGGGTIIVANRTSASAWETFRLWRVDESTFQFRVYGNQFIGLDHKDGNHTAVAVAKYPGYSETFKIIRDDKNHSRIRIRAPNGLFLQAKSTTTVTADYREERTRWGDDDPSVFVLTIVSTLRGDFQVTNGYGRKKAAEVMREHWRTFIVEDDFRFISHHGINGVRIPVGWWIAFEDNPPWPFVAGSLEALDNAFRWAQKYNIKVVVDLHAAPGSQNGFEHSGTRDGSLEWGKTNETIAMTLSVIDFLAARYAHNPNLIAVELINEPLYPNVPLDTLESYYKAGYATVRRHSPYVYVMMSNRLNTEHPTELLGLASQFQGSVIDIHYYSLFTTEFNGWSVQQNLNYVNNNRASELGSLVKANGPLIFVGEWTGEWEVNNATKKDYQEFARAQLKVYDRATFGWGYWTLKNVEHHWSLEWMIKNGYISLPKP